jgi:hypothetical protein
LSRALPARYVPPSGFGYPLDGFLPSSPCRLCFAPAALLGFPLRSVPLSKGIRTSPPGCTHLPFHRPFFPPRGRPARSAAVPGLRPSRESLAEPHVISARPAGCSPGVPPSRACRRRPCRGFRPNSSHALGQAPDELQGPCFRVSIGLRLAPPRPGEVPEGEATLLGFRTASIPDVEAAALPSYGFTDHRAVHCCRQADDLRKLRLPDRGRQGPK